ncbi:solute carrier organic anion transporter family member 2B1 [Aplochiton taeniatus]
MAANQLQQNADPQGSRPPIRRRSPFNSIKFFVCCHGLLQLAVLLVSGYLKSSISTIERRYGFSSQKAGVLAAFNEVGNTILIVFVSFFGSRVHRPRFIGGGALLTSVAAMVMALPHFLSGPYEYTDHKLSLTNNTAGLCQLESTLQKLTTNQSCTEQESTDQQGVFPLLLLGQLLLGIGAVPIQPFGISYIDDYASRRNSPLYLGILLAVTSIGPAFGFLMGAFTARFYVDIDKLSKEEIKLDPKDLRWVGAWWLGFLVASCFLFVCALPYLFFPRDMPKESGSDSPPRLPPGFPRIALRTLRNPVYLLAVLAQVHLAAMVAGLATFMAKFIERQFTQTVSFATMMIGGVDIPLAVLGIVMGGALMRMLNMSVKGAARMCAVAILFCILTALPMLLIGCSTQKVAGIFPPSQSPLSCSVSCSCPEEAFNPVCGSDGVEFRSPCHAGCTSSVLDPHSLQVQNYTSCSCVESGGGGGGGAALPGTCGSGCSHLLLPFMVLSGLTCFIASFSQTPSFMMILRTVPPEDKSFAVGVQYMLFRVLAFMPAPVLYGMAIDSTCVSWGRKCSKVTSCQYYNLDLFRWRFLGLQALFVCGALVCFVFSLLVLRKKRGSQALQTGSGYQLVNGQNPPHNITKTTGTSSKELESPAT